MHSVFQLINPSLKARLQLLHRLTDTIRQCLPDEVANRCWAANITGQTLTIAIDSATLAIQVRYRQQEILESLKNEPACHCQVYLKRVKIKVVSISDGQRNPTRACRISRNNAAGLQSAAQFIEDEELSKALLRLAAHADNG